MNQFPLSSKQKVPFMCFSCRIGLKAPIPFYYEEYGDKHRPEWANPKCPVCKNPMAYLGRYFKVPAKNALTQWRKAELLYRNNWIADGYSGAPRTLRDAREFIQRPGTTVACHALKRRAETEKRWRQLRTKRHHKVA